MKTQFTFYSSKRTLYAAAFIVFAMGLSTVARAAEPAFEAYYKFLLGGEHRGYVVQRYEADSAKKELTSTYYIFVKTPSGSTTESLVAKSDLNFEPISYQYSALVDGKAKLVDAVFKNKKMTGKIVDSGKQKNISLPVPPNGFLSTFLNYVMLKNGLMAGKNYKFIALSEEDPAFHEGTANIQSEQKFNGLDSFKVAFNYKGIPFTGFIGTQGETFGSISTLQDAGTQIVKTRAEAVGTFNFNEKHIRTLFGTVPTGIKNALYARPAVTATTSTPPPSASDLSTTGAKPNINAKPKDQ